MRSGFENFDFLRVHQYWNLRFICDLVFEILDLLNGTFRYSSITNLFGQD